MNEQGNLLDKAFSPELSEAEKIRGTERSLSGLSLTAWKQMAGQFVVDGILPGAQFTADDLVKWVGLPTECDLFARCNNALGGMFSGLCRRGIIRAVGYTTSDRVSNHGRILRVWERV